MLSHEEHVPETSNYVPETSTYGLACSGVFRGSGAGKLVKIELLLLQLLELDSVEDWRENRLEDPLDLNVYDEGLWTCNRKVPQIRTNTLHNSTTQIC